MSYENVNLGSGHGVYHHVTKCIHDEEMRRDVPAGAKFSQMLPEKAQQPQDVSQTLEGLIADLRDVSGRSGLFGGSGTLSEGEKSAGASVISLRDSQVHDTLPKTQIVRAENAASVACFGLEKPLDAPLEMQDKNGIRKVSESRRAQSGNSFLRRQREAVKTRIGGNVRKGLRRIKAVLARVMQEKEQPVDKSTLALEHGREYLLDSYGSDGAYKQMSKGALLKSNMNEKA